MKTPAGSVNVVPLRPATANENIRGVLYATLTEGLHASDAPWAYQPIVGQATDSTTRGFLQALDPDPMLWPLS
jgi:hypothetical protein